MRKSKFLRLKILKALAMAETDDGPTNSRSLVFVCSLGWGDGRVSSGECRVAGECRVDETERIRSAQNETETEEMRQDRARQKRTEQIRQDGAVMLQDGTEGDGGERRKRDKVGRGQRGREDRHITRGACEHRGA